MGRASIDDVNRFMIETRPESHQERKEVLLSGVRAPGMWSKPAIIDELIHVATNNRVADPISEFSGVCGLMRQAVAKLEQVVREATRPDDRYALSAPRRKCFA